LNFGKVDPEDFMTALYILLRDKAGRRNVCSLKVTAKKMPSEGRHFDKV
jgi:hypothetical protein